MPKSNQRAPKSLSKVVKGAKATLQQNKKIIIRSPPSKTVVSPTQSIFKAPPGKAMKNNHMCNNMFT